MSLEELVHEYDLGTPMGISPCIFEVSMSGKRGGRGEDSEEEREDEGSNCHVPEF